MRPYETMVVLSNQLGDGKKALIDRLENVIRNGGGTVDVSHDWGNRRLAYTIGKNADAHYYLLEYQAEGPVVAEVERTLRISDGVLRYLSLQQDHTGLPPVRTREERPREHVPLYEMRGMRGESARQDAPAREDRTEEPVGETAAADTPATEETE
jgi:small subunit ribosomal protein S6